MKRAAVHASVLALALLLRWMTPEQALLMAAAACVFNLIFLPALWPALFRSGERGMTSGIFLYPLAVLLVLSLLPIPLAAAAWAVMAWGDAAAGIVGRAVGRPALPWNRQKTVAGSLAFFLAALAGARLLLLWTRAPDSSWKLCLAAALAGALAESLPVPVNDNILAPLAAAAGLCALTGTVPAPVVALSPAGFAWSAALAVAAGALRLVTLSGALGGAAVGTLLYSFGGPQGFALLAVFFVLGSAATRLAYARKAALGVAEQRRGARTAEQAVANAGAAVFFAFFGWPVAMVASLAAAAADTIATEVGPLFRGPVFLLVNGKAVAPGTSGGVSIAGTLAGAAAAALVAGLGAALGAVRAEQVVGVTVAAATGSAVDSLLGGTLERRGLLNNEGVNFLGTLAAGLLAEGLMN